MLHTVHSLLSGHSSEDLTPAQKQLYASERVQNFRQIAKLFATRSTYTLSTCDLVPIDIQVELAELGEFAELPYVDAEFIFNSVNMLSRPSFPLEGYDALREAKLVASFRGDVANVPTCVAYRERTKQLIIAFSGTATVKQMLYDLCATKVAHPAAPGCAVHSGFWKMYMGCKTQVFAAIRKAICKHHVAELVSVGHSMGAALSYLLAVDLLCPESPLPAGVTLTVAAFGSPRVGNARLYERWQELAEAYRSADGPGSVREFLVKANNDGIHAIPTEGLGYKHLARNPLYQYHGRLFYIPTPEKEHGDFNVSPHALDQTRAPDHPRGGHQYYNCRSFEKVVLRMYWLDKMKKKYPDNWEQAYVAQIAQLEKIAPSPTDSTMRRELSRSPVSRAVEQDDEESEPTRTTATRARCSHEAESKVGNSGLMKPLPAFPSEE